MQTTSTHPSPARSPQPEASTPFTAAAHAWADFARQHGARFDVERKADEAARFSAQGGARVLGLATKLAGVAAGVIQLNLQLAREHGADRRYAELTAEVDGGEVLLLLQGAELGRVQPKHLPWLLPLVPTHRVRFYLLAVTGGTAGKPTLGCNVAISGVESAIEAKRRGWGFRIRLKEPAQHI